MQVSVWGYSITPLCLGFAILCGFALPSEANADETLERFVVNGDVDKDGTTSLKDLVRLGQNWDVTLDRWAAENTTIASDIRNKWQKKDLTQASAAKIAAFSSQLAANIDPSTKALSPERESKYMAELRAAGFTEKGAQEAQRIGVAVDFPVKGLPDVDIRGPIFNVPVDNNGKTPLIGSNFTQLPAGEGYQNFSEGDTTDQAIPRYNIPKFDATNPVQSTKFYFDYIDDYSEERKALGYDIEIDARYAAFTGNISADGSDTFYADKRNHKVILKITQSFGWFYMPSAAIEANYDKFFKERLDKYKDPNNTEEIDLVKEFGQYVATAVHKVRSLVVELTVKTRKQEDRNEFGSRIRASFNNGITSVSLAAGIKAMKEQNDEVKEVTVFADAIGGPSDLTLKIDGKDQTRALQAWLIDIAQAAQNGAPDDGLWSKLVDAWISAGTVANASDVDFIYTPIASFASKPSSPFDKSVNMHNWFKRYSAVDQQLAYAHQILEVERTPIEGAIPNPDNIRIKTAFNYLQALQPFTPPAEPGGAFTYGGYNTFEKYLGHQYKETVELYFDLFKKGRLIFTSTVQAPELFQPQDTFWQIPEFVAPPIRLTLNKQFIETQADIVRELGFGCDVNNNITEHSRAICNSCLSAKWNASVTNFDLDNQQRYKLLYSLQALGNNNPCDQAAGKFLIEHSSPETYEFTLSVTGAGDNCSSETGCFANWDLWASLGGHSFYVGILDSTTGEVVAVRPSTGPVTPDLYSLIGTTGEIVD